MQTYSNWELILINDGSIDGSVATAENFARKYPEKIFLYSHKDNKNRGASSSRNLGVEHARGDLITFLDSDDVFNANALELQIDAFKQNPDADVVCGTLEYWFSWSNEREGSERDFLVNLGVKSDMIYEPPTLLTHNLAASGRKPGMGCVAVRKGVTKKLRLFEDDFLYVCEDQLFWSRLSLHRKIYIHDECLVKYRQHRRSSSAVLVGSGKTVSDWKVLLDWLEDYLTNERIEDKEVWKALRKCKKEIRLRDRYRWIFDVYRRFLPYHIRYRVRDFIIRWRKKS